jgi:hypothetical protein
MHADDDDLVVGVLVERKDFLATEVAGACGAIS